MEIKVFDQLPEEAKAIRLQVFSEEQGFTEEFDQQDQEAVHLVLYKEGRAIGTTRIYIQDGRYHIGRFALVKEARGQGSGNYLFLETIEEIRRRGGKEIEISAQNQLVAYYERLGFEKIGPVYEEQGWPHQDMVKILP